MKRVLAWADKGLFGTGSPAALCLLRIFVCSLVALNVITWIAEAGRWFTEGGYVPVAARDAWQPPMRVRFFLFGNQVDTGWSIPYFDPMAGLSDTGVTVYLLALLALAVLAALGWKTRWTVALLFLGLLGAHNRNPLILQGADTAMRVLLFYLALSPCGSLYSLDARGKGHPGPVSLWPQRLAAWNLALVYLSTVWLKLATQFGNTWRSGTATWYTARLEEFHRFPVPAFMTEFPMVRYTTFATLAVEIALGTLAFYRPARRPVLIAGLAMHAYIEYSMNIPFFSWMMASWYIVFYSGEEVEAFLARFQRGPKEAATA